MAQNRVVWQGGLGSAGLNGHGDNDCDISLEQALASRYDGEASDDMNIILYDTVILSRKPLSNMKILPQGRVVVNTGKSYINISTNGRVR